MITLTLISILFLVILVRSLEKRKSERSDSQSQGGNWVNYGPMRNDDESPPYVDIDDGD